MISAADALEAAVRPLRFAARRNFANLPVLKDVERTVEVALQGVQSRHPNEQSVCRELRRLMVGFDGLVPEEKQARVLAALRLVDVGLAQPAAGQALPGASKLGSPDGVRTNASPSPAASPVSPGREAAPRRTPKGSSSHPSPAAPKPRSVHSPSPFSPPPEGLPNQRAFFLAAPRAPVQTLSKRVAMKDAQPEYPLASVVGVGPKTAEKLQAKRIETVQDALFFLPTRYEDRSEVRTIESLHAGDKALVQGVIAVSALRPGRRRMWEVAVRDGTGVLSIRFFRFSAQEMQSRYPVGTRVRAFGAVTTYGAQRQMAHPEMEVLLDDQVPVETPVLPVYPDVDGVPPRTLRRILQSIARSAAARVHDPVPESIRDRWQLAPLAPAVRAAHCPEEGGVGPALTALRRRLAFDELLYLQLALASNRSHKEQEVGLAQDLGPRWAPLAEKALPFALTGAQARVLNEIADDMEAPRPMSRLLQGDVGSGKTAVALLSAAMVHHAGRQACLLAPTEILAEQHAKSAQKVLGALGLQTALLTASTTAKARRTLIRALQRGDVHLLTGTHAVLEPDVVFRDLGLVLIDEQHRFGVEQRARLLAKRGPPPPDVLVMTATPIPRTLTLSVYGDLRVSVIDELPPGRSPTETRVYAAKEVAKAYQEVRRALDEGRQAYVVFPLVEASDQLELKSATEAVQELARVFHPHRVGLLHGKMKSDEKSATMQAFAHQQLGVLVATTVIEVGVDVPNATVMVIEEADRFGLSQLHQLRGRVGRGRYGGRCLLIAGEKAGADASERLAVMAETQDGFIIAQRDLEIRGPGEVLGTRQSGLPDLVMADLATDGRLIEQAQQEAERVLDMDPNLTHEAHRGLRGELYRRFSGKLARIHAG